jgi:HD-GYP domain-containing protein (c-di-GMP phosphodiesterase class II)
MVIPNTILTKPDKLSVEEYALMRQHTYFTYNVLNSIGAVSGKLQSGQPLS